MSTGYRCRAHVLWITLQHLLMFAYPGPRVAMAIAHFAPYVSEFEYASRFHPSKNPDCPTSGWADNSGRNSGSRRYRRSPEEGSPVGQEPSIEVRAILVRCPKSSEETDDVPINRNVYNITAGRSQDILDFHGFDRDEPAHHSEVRDCRRKLIVTMKFNNIGRTKTQEEFVVIDHVLDPVTMHKSRLLNPFVVKVRQEPVLQLYGLKFHGVVNAEAREEVINKKLSNYTGCDDASDNPTCGQMIFEEKTIPYSQGFCCSCDPELNDQRQASILNETVVSSFPSFFTKSKDRPIRPFKSPRSVNTNLRDIFHDSDETDDLASPDEAEKEDVPRSSYESLANSNDRNFDKNFVAIGDGNSTIDGSYEDERDLIKLKNTSKMKKEDRRGPNRKSIFEEVDGKTAIVPHVIFVPPGFSSRTSDSSGFAEKNREVAASASQKSLDGNPNSDAISEYRSSGREIFASNQPTTDRYTASYQNQRSVNLAAELTKLEEDYKKLRLSSIMRTEERNNEAEDKMPVYDRPVGNNSGQKSNYDDARNSIGPHENEFPTKISSDRRQQHGSSLGRKMPSLEDNFYGRGSSLSIDIELAVRPKEKSTIRPSSSVAVSSETCSSDTSPPLTTTSPSLSETETPAVLRQKLVSDRVYPSNEKSNVSRVGSYPAEVTTDLSQKLDSYVADLLAKAVISDNDKNSLSNDQTSNDERITPVERYDATSLKNSITESGVPLEGTAKNLRDTDDPGTGIDNTSDRAESPTDSYSSFSSGNLSEDDAILLSGSLKNQLANWSSNDERNDSKLESAKNKLKGHVGEEIEVRYNGTVGDVEVTTVPKEDGDIAERLIRHEDRSTTAVTDRRPVEVFLGTDEEYDSPLGREDEETSKKTRHRDEKAFHNIFLGYPIPEAKMDFTSRKKSRLRNLPRSYRSIAEDDALFVKDNDRQRSIDKQIDNEFEEISDALKEAADGPKVVREKPKSDGIFEQDDSVVRKFATMFGKFANSVTRENRLPIHNRVASEENPEARTEISKHTEAFLEPVSEIMLTTEHRIIVDRFRLVNDFQEIPAGHEKPLHETASTDSRVTDVSSKIRDRKHEEFPATSPPESTTIIEKKPFTGPLSEIPQTTDHRSIVDRFELVNDFNEIADKKRLQKRILTGASSTEVSPTTRYLDDEKDFATHDSISIAKPQDSVAINNDTSHRIALSPVLMIENLKKELRKEAERFSSLSPGRSTAGGSNFREVRTRAGPVNEVREINTELTPAEKVEDSITDEETLPPDEETKYTTDALSKATRFSNTVNSTSFVEPSTINEDIFPQLEIQSFDAKFLNTSHPLPLKRANEFLILLEEPLPSSARLSPRHGNKRNYGKRLRRRRSRRHNRHRKRSIEAKRNIGDSTSVRYIVKGGSENEDDEHPWFDTTAKSEATDAKDRSDDATTMPVTNATISGKSAKNRKRRFSIEMPLDWRKTSENDRGSTESSNDAKLKSTAGKLYVSIARIPESDYRGSASGLRIEEITKMTRNESNFDSNFDEARILSLKWPENSGEVDEMPIFRDTENLSRDAGSEGRETEERTAEAIGRSKRNLRASSAGNSLEGEHFVDGATFREDVGRNNKRNDPMDSCESEPEAQIFYDYEEAESAADSRNDENAGSLGSYVPREVDPVVSDKKHLRGIDENDDESRVKSSPITQMDRNREMIVKRGGSMSPNHRLDGRSHGEIVSKSGDLIRKDVATVSSASLDAEERGQGHCSGNQFAVEPSDGWKEKMELLKLKKHADVLKEYLNWRQDVGPPESRGLPGYTTRISPTNAEEGQTSDFLTTGNFRLSDETAMRSTPSTYSTVTDELTSTVEQRTDNTEFTGWNDERRVTNLTTISGSFETTATSAIPRANDRPGNCSGDSSTATVKVQTSTGCPDKKGEENSRHDDESSTGRILRPCGYQSGSLATCRTEHGGIKQSTANSGPDVVRGHQKQLSDIDRDLIIISVIEKNRHKNKTQFYATKEDGTSSRFHRFHDIVGTDPIFRHHRRRNKSKNNEIPAVRKTEKIRYNRRAGRQLMSLEDAGERNDDEEYDLAFEDSDENRYADSSKDEDTSNDDERDSEMWNQKWNRIIDKIINENSSDSWKSANSSGSSSKEPPSESRSALQQLHVNNADKYIRQIAKDIVHNTNIHEPKRAKGGFVDEAEANGQRDSSRRRRPGTRHDASRRKLHSYPTARRKVVRKSENVEDFGSFEDQRSASEVGSKIAESCKDRRDSSARRSHPAPRGADANASFSNETSVQDKAGRDFAISLSGRIHVEGGTNGQPMSISFDTSPEIQSGNETSRTSQNGTSTFDNATKTDGENAPSANFLSSLFNIATVPKDLARHPPDESKNFSAAASIRQSVRDVDEEKLRYSRENRREKLPGSSRKYPKIRKSRAAEEEFPERFTKRRDDRSYDLGDSQESEEIGEGSELEDYRESSIDDAYSDLAEYDDTPLVAAERRSPSFRDSRREVNRSPALEHRSLNTPEVKVIKIIPLNSPKSYAALSSTDTKHEDTKASRMTASQLPKTEDETVPGTTVKPGEIEPAPLPPHENEGDDEFNPVPETMEGTNFPSKSSGSCSSQSESSDGNLENADAINEPPIDRRISTSDPVSLRVIGLVSVKQPANGSAGDANVNSDSNYEIIPLVHVKIEQQSGNRGDVPSRPMEGCCPGVEVANPSKDFHGDRSPCSKFNDEGSIVQGEGNTRRPEVATLNMENDEELREPIQVGSCPGSNRKDSEILTDYSNEDRLDRTRSTEVARPCGVNRETTTTPKTRFEDGPGGTDSRKTIRLKNMLAMMEFMKKMKEIMNGEAAPEPLARGNEDIVIKLDRVVVLPNNRSDETRKKIDEPEESTDRVVMMGEGVRHKPSTNGLSFQKNFRVSMNKGYDEGTSPPKIGDRFDEMKTGNLSSEADWKTSEKDRDKSFLFYGGSDKLGAPNQSPTGDSKHRELSSIDRGSEDAENRSDEEEGSENTHRNKIRLIEMMKNAPNVVDRGNEEANLSSESGGDPSNPSANPDDSETNRRFAVRNFERRFNDRLRSLRNRERDENGQGGDVIENVATKERKAADNDRSLIPKAKRHRSPMHLRSNRMRYDIRNERDAKSQIYRRRSLPTGREVSRFGNRKFGRYAAAKGVPKEKRMKKKKKKKRRRKKKKKKKKKKKEKSHREAAVKGKAWWPFGRQLMSVAVERGLISESNFDRSQVERVKTEGHRNRRVSLPFEARRRRRVHRVKYPHDKNKKKRRKHKKGKKKKKKKKTKGRQKQKSGSRSKRQIRPGGNQVRGGQDCMDRRHPPDVNPAKYLESAHCLRFSDMWYSVYELESPIMEHTVYLQLFEKHSLEDGTTHWDDLTQGTMVRMGTFTRHQRDSKPTIVFTYSGAKTESQKRALNLDPARQRLLVPSPVPPKKSSQYREVKGGSDEYLVVQTDTISRDGNDCDKAGVGFAAFSKQEDRCGRSKGSCLRNQPLAYWRHDTEARESGRRGCYFLSNFASVPTNPIKYNVSGSGSREYLGLEYHSAHVSAIDIEVRTDYNAIVRVGSSGRVTEVYVDSTALEHTVVTVVISNMGLASSPYQPRITDCPTGLPVSWTKAKGIMQVIPPQHDQRVTLDLYGQLLTNGFHCSVEVVNHRGELVAMRRIRVQKMDRCFCVWHCLCACIGSVSGMGCQPMSPEHYHAAGFQGPVPVVTNETSILMNAVKDVLMLSALLVLLLLLLGILKWFVGMFVPAVGRWGLDSLLEGSRIEEYLEPELKCRCVVTDDDGAPVHPDTGQRTVRICSRKLEFVLNLIFFLTYPIAICCSYFRRSLNASRQRNCCPDESKMCLINEKGSCPKMICVSTYGDSRNSKLEAEDTRYVMNELKKSQESLENPKRTKKKDSHRNGSGKNLSKKSSQRNKSASDVSAKRFVDDLLKRRMVFRNLTEPIGGLLVPAGIAYCLRGYFLNAEDGGYRFITPCPFKQHWLIVNNQKKASKPPEIYPSKHFMRSFSTARDVYESNELSLTPQGVCVNVQYLEDR